MESKKLIKVNGIQGVVHMEEAALPKKQKNIKIIEDAIEERSNRKREIPLF